MKALKTRYYLYINTANQQLAEISIVDHQGVILKTSSFFVDRQFKMQYKLLPLINKMLFAFSSEANDLSGIIVIKKSAALVSLRLGLTIVNTLSYALKIPVIGLTEELSSLEPVIKKIKETPEKFSLITPEYENNPMLK